MTQGFESVRHELDQKRHQLEQDLASARGRVTEIEADLERVHEALGALTGHKKKSSRSRSRSSKPAPSIQELQQHIAQVRSESPFADAGALERGVKALVRQSGSSQKNFKALFAEALLTSPGSHGDLHTSSHSSHVSHSHHGSGSHGAFEDSDPFSA